MLMSTVKYNLFCDQFILTPPLAKYFDCHFKKSKETFASYFDLDKAFGNASIE